MPLKQTTSQAKDIRLKSAGLMLIAVFAIMPAGHILWALMMKQYDKQTRWTVAGISWLVGIYLIMYGGATMFGDDSGKYLNYWIPGGFIFLAPFLYTLIEPLPKKPRRPKATRP